MAGASVYRTESGLIMRITESDEGGLRVQTLAGDAWMDGRIGMVGLRLSPSTVRLTTSEIRALPR